MSLWYRPIRDITFDDVDAFCSMKLSEGTRLDYKVSVSEKGNAQAPRLEKLVAAFANTLGGIILLGVDADKKTNQPIWPPADGMPDEPGIEDQIISICQANIFPPVRP